jgi:hypothetical protein
MGVRQIARILQWKSTPCCCFLMFATRVHVVISQHPAVLGSTRKMLTVSNLFNTFHSLWMMWEKPARHERIWTVYRKETVALMQDWCRLHCTFERIRCVFHPPSNPIIITFPAFICWTNFAHLTDFLRHSYVLRYGGHSPWTISSSIKHLHNDITPTWFIVASPTTHVLAISPLFYISTACMYHGMYTHVSLTLQACKAVTDRRNTALEKPTLRITFRMWMWWRRRGRIWGRIWGCTHTTYSLTDVSIHIHTFPCVSHTNTLEVLLHVRTHLISVWTSLPTVNHVDKRSLLITSCW